MEHFDDALTDSKSAAENLQSPQGLTVGVAFQAYEGYYGDQEFSAVAVGKAEPLRFDVDDAGQACVFSGAKVLYGFDGEYLLEEMGNEVVFLSSVDGEYLLLIYTKVEQAQEKLAELVEDLRIEYPQAFVELALACEMPRQQSAELLLSLLQLHDVSTQDVSKGMEALGFSKEETATLVAEVVRQNIMNN